MNQPSKTLFSVEGHVRERRSYSLNDLLAMDRASTGKVRLICGDGEIKGHIGACNGVLLTDIINDTDVITTEHNDTKKMFIIASSGDDYKTVFSWQELYNSDNGEGILVILEKEGVFLHDVYGGVDLYSANDFLTGPRYVKNLQRLEIVLLN